MWRWRRWRKTSRSSAKQIRNGYRVLAMRAANLMPSHLRRNLKCAATEGAAKLRQIRRPLGRIPLRWMFLWLITRWLLHRETSGDPKKLWRRQQHCPLAQRAANLLPGIGRINLDHARTEGALHRHRVHRAGAVRGRPGINTLS